MALIEEIDDADGGETSKKPQSKMTEEERAELADKLDKQLDDFIDSLEKRGYTEGWPEDRWEEVNHIHTHIYHKSQVSTLNLGNGKTSIFYERIPKTRR